ncbi:hypothetical protein FACS1894111_03870 [Clostridia bacterium]|nr:hypothetical protein FACS1894111_03870 [Clostridia bacterium]
MKKQNFENKTFEQKGRRKFGYRILTLCCSLFLLTTSIPVGQVFAAEQTQEQTQIQEQTQTQNQDSQNTSEKTSFSLGQEQGDESEQESTAAKLISLQVNDETVDVNGVNYFNDDVTKISGKIQLGEDPNVDGTFNKRNGTKNAFSDFDYSESLGGAKFEFHVEAGSLSVLQFTITNIEACQRGYDTITFAIPRAENKYNEDYAFNFVLSSIGVGINGGSILSGTATNGMVSYETELTIPNGYISGLVKSDFSFDSQGAFGNAVIDGLEKIDTQHIKLKFHHPAIHLTTASHNAKLTIGANKLNYQDGERNQKPYTIAVTDGYVPAVEYPVSGSDAPKNATVDGAKLTETISHDVLAAIFSVTKELCSSKDGFGPGKAGMAGVSAALGLAFDIADMFESKDLDKSAEMLGIEKTQDMINGVNNNLNAIASAITSNQDLNYYKNWMDNLTQVQNRISPTKGTMAVKDALRKGDAALIVSSKVLDDYTKNPGMSNEQLLASLQALQQGGKQISPETVDVWFKTIFNHDGQNGSVQSPLDVEFTNLQNQLLYQTGNRTGFAYFDKYMSLLYDYNTQSFSNRSAFYKGILQEYEYVYAILHMAIQFDKDAAEDQAENAQAVMNKLEAEGLHNGELPQADRNSLQAIYGEAKSKKEQATANAASDADELTSLEKNHKDIVDAEQEEVKTLEKETDYAKNKGSVYSYVLHKPIQKGYRTIGDTKLAAQQLHLLNQKLPDGKTMQQWIGGADITTDDYVKNALSETEITTLMQAAHAHGKTLFQDLIEAGFSSGLQNYRIFAGVGSCRNDAPFHSYDLSKWSCNLYAKGIANTGNKVTESLAEAHVFHLSWEKHWYWFGGSEWEYNAGDDTRNWNVNVLSNCFDATGKTLNLAYAN